MSFRSLWLLTLGLAACASTPPAPPPALAGSDPLLPGENCTQTAAPAWTLDPAAATATLGEGGFKMKVPAGYRVTQERDGLLVLQGPREGQGPQPVFEVFASPHCDKYDTTFVERRLAQRALAACWSTIEVGRIFDKTQWRPSKGNGVGTAREGKLLLRDAEVALALYYTPVGDSDQTAISLAAACPRFEDPRRRCDRSWRWLQKQVALLNAPPPPPAPPPSTPSPPTP